jgi:hypothetical protein
MKRLLPMLGLAAALFGGLPSAQAFCGFYVAKADAKLFNKASKVVVARTGERTAVTMASDYEGELKEFALVVPVPTVVKKDQIKVVDNAVVDHLDAYSAPRLVEYHDDDPCRPIPPPMVRMAAPTAMPDMATRPKRKADALGVKIEAEYTVGEYDIVILSATQSDGLVTYLNQEGYKIPDGAAPVLGSYIKQDMKFFLARVNLKEQAKSGARYLRPIQVTYDTPKFMLPIRLGTVNADGAQELFIYFLTKQGRVETTNYRTIRLPEAQEIPLYVKDRFGDFYRDMFTQQVRRESERGVFMEYAWDMNWCDPCAANPLSADELRSLGVFWQEPVGRLGKGMPQAQNVFLTRLHVRYDAAHFPEDLTFQETSDRANFQARYILRHPWTGSDDCPAAAAYRQHLCERYEREAQTLANLTGWKIAEIRQTMNISSLPAAEGRKWYQRLWAD